MARRSKADVTKPELDKPELDTGVDLPLGSGEVVLAQRTDDDGVTWVVTSAGRKIGIGLDGSISVTVGPELDFGAPAESGGAEEEREAADGGAA